VQCGVVSGPREVSLFENEKGVLSGDSGGGVFSEDGDLVGTLMGGSSIEKRVVKFRPNDFEVTFNSAAAPAMTKVCENGVCRMVPANQVPMNRSSAQQSTQNGHWAKGGLFGLKTIWVPEP
jgi:hypothetical protein